MKDDFLSVRNLEVENKFSKKKIYSIVTGGAGRIGSIYTSVLLKKGFNVIIASRSQNHFLKFRFSLDKRYHSRIRWVKLDLSDLVCV